MGSELLLVYYQHWELKIYQDFDDTFASTPTIRPVWDSANNYFQVSSESPSYSDTFHLSSI